jgi:hypothetical protein
MVALGCRVDLFEDRPEAHGFERRKVLIGMSPQDVQVDRLDAHELRVDLTRQ